MKKLLLLTIFYSRDAPSLHRLSKLAHIAMSDRVGIQSHEIWLQTYPRAREWPIVPRTYRIDRRWPGLKCVHGIWQLKILPWELSVWNRVGKASLSTHSCVVGIIVHHTTPIMIGVTPLKLWGIQPAQPHAESWVEVKWNLWDMVPCTLKKLMLREKTR